MEVMQLDAIGNWQGFEILFRDSREASLHRERGGLTTTRGCLFGFVRKKIAHARERNGEKSSQRARAPFFFVDGGPMR